MKPLPPDIVFGLIAPAGPPRPGVLAQLPALFDRLGLRVKTFPGCHGPAVLGHLAASDGQRLADLHAALADDEVGAVLCLRGGYGCHRLLAGLDTGLVRHAAKPLIGYSDITALHAVWAQQGVPAWHAPMPASDWVQPGGLADAERLVQALRQGVRPGDSQTAALVHPLSRDGVAQGRLLGGNLAVLTALVGTPFMPDLRGAIVFLEDISEDAYRVDRYLAQLRLAGAFDGVAGVVLGSFTEGETPADAVLADALQGLQVPVLAGWPAGHGQPNHALPLGLPVRLDVGARELRW